MSSTLCVCVCVCVCVHIIMYSFLFTISQSLSDILHAHTFILNPIYNKINKKQDFDKMYVRMSTEVL